MSCFPPEVHLEEPHFPFPFGQSAFIFLCCRLNSEGRCFYVRLSNRCWYWQLAKIPFWSDLRLLMFVLCRAVH